MKICCIIHSLQLGGMERVMSILANHFSITEEVYIILIGKNPVIEYEISPQVNLIRLNVNHDSSFRLLATINTIFQLRKTIKKIKPDSILSFGEIWNNLVALACLGLKQKLFISDRCKPDKKFGYAQDYLRQILYPTANGIIAQTAQAKTIYQGQFKHDNIKVIPNPINFIHKEEEINKENIVLSVGRLIKTKQFDQLIKSFVSINNKNWKLVIVGGDALKQSNLKELRKLIPNDFKNQIALVGAKKNVKDYYNRSQIFALMSSSEGFPNVIGEALSARLPVVCYDCVAGPRDLVKSGFNGILIPLNDHSSFEQKLKKLMMDSQELQKLASNTVESVAHLDPKEVSKQYLDFIKN